MADGQFDKDFGYLMPFLDKVTAAVSAVADPAARDELARLMADQKARWTRIRQILSGTSPQSATNPASSATAPRKDSEAQSDTTAKEAAAFTVGSLRPPKG